MALMTPIVAVMLAGEPAQGRSVTNGLVTVRAVRSGAAWTGFEVVAGGKAVATVGLSSGKLLTATQCKAARRSLTFTGLTPLSGCGLRLGAGDRIVVALSANECYPVVSFSLRIAAFDKARWLAKAGKEPFHFLAICEPEAEVWHQRGWLNATPYADPFPLLLDTHVGTPEISAYKFNRNWSYTPPLGANPIPVIGLWAPKRGRYVGLEFQTARLADNSERDIATGYRWCGTSDGYGVAGAGDPGSVPASAHEQFVALVYPYGGDGYQNLVLPEAGARIASRATLIWSNMMPATGDPNRFVYSILWPKIKGALPRVPSVVDLSWVPGGIKLRDFGGPAGPGLIGGVEASFQVPGTRLIGGWGWHNEGPTQNLKRAPSPLRQAQAERQAEELLQYAKRFTVQGDPCVFWEKPLTGEWTTEWGGKPATTLHNANGFAAGRLFLGLHRDLGKSEYLPVVDGVLNWARHVAWTRNEFADVPSSPFAIGGTLTASFCLDYYMAFRDASDEEHRRRARAALDLAHSFTYRYLVMWLSDSNRFDGLDPTFLWEPNSGRDWTGAACANEVFWNIDTLAQTAVHTGDPALMWALQGTLERWHVLYQDRYRDSLADYAAADMAEGYGLYEGNVYGVGKRATYGFASPLFMTEPVGDTAVRILAGERAAMAFCKGGARVTIGGYRYSHPGSLSFTLEGAPASFGVSLTVPYVDVSGKSVAVVRDGERIELKPGEGLVRPPQAVWSLTLRGLRPGDTVIVGEPDGAGHVLPSAPPLTIAAPAHDAASVLLPYDTEPDVSWDRLDSWAGLPHGRMWRFGIPLSIAPEGKPWALARRAKLTKPIGGSSALAVLYSDGDGQAPAVLLSDGREVAADHLPATAWRAWPPIYSRRAIVAIAETGGKDVVGIEPRGRLVFSVAPLPASDPAVRAALARGHAEYVAAKAEENVIARFAEALAALPGKPIAVLPPSPASPPVSLATRAGLMRHAVELTPRELVDEGAFSAARFPVALYAGGENYVHTVGSSGDAAQAMVRYVNTGGTLLLVSMGPFPMFYGERPGGKVAEPLPSRLGMPIYNSIEAPPQAKLTVEMASGQTFVEGVPASFAYSAGDPRLRSINPSLIPTGARYTPICRVRDASGKGYGDAAGIVDLGTGKGSVLYVWGGLMRDDRYGPAFSAAIVRFMVAKAGAAGHR